VGSVSKLWITYLKRDQPEVFYVEGDYDELFKEMTLKKHRGVWESEKKRWRLQKEHLAAVKAAATKVYDVVKYSEGGDFVTL